MSKKSILPQRRRHVWLYDEDWDWLTEWRKANYGGFKSEADELYGNGTIVREMVHARIKAAKDKQIRALDSSSHSSSQPQAASSEGTPAYD